MAIQSLNRRPPADRIDPATRVAVEVFLARIRGAYPVAGAWLYGSRARGDHMRDSDADVAVLLDGPKRNRVDVLLEMSDLSYDILLDHGIHISPLPIWREEWTDPQGFSNPALIGAIRHEGVPL